MTILGAMSLGGIIASMTIEEATDGDIFLAYVEHILCPALKPGDVVVMDNLSSHKIKGVRRLIEKAGAEVLYLPPYSPDLNPIEKAWSKLKQILRAAKARTKEALEKAITEAIRMITPDNSKAWFHHCINGLQYFLKCSRTRLNSTAARAATMWPPAPIHSFLPSQLSPRQSWPDLPSGSCALPRPAWRRSGWWKILAWLPSRTGRRLPPDLPARSSCIFLFLSSC